MRIPGRKITLDHLPPPPAANSKLLKPAVILVKRNFTDIQNTTCKSLKQEDITDLRSHAACR